MTENNEFYNRHRPRKFADVIGQDAAVSALTSMGKRKAVPHALLFVGPSGTGKTTLARIVARKLKCSPRDYDEINAADKRGIDDIRAIRSRMHLAPLPGGECRVWTIDECHRLTPDAQSILLKMLEDAPARVYFMLATTDPQKLMNTIITRCTEIKLRSLDAGEIETLLASAAEAEGVELDEDVRSQIANAADGSPRKALVILNTIMGMPVEEQMAAVSQKSVKSAAIDLCRELAGKQPSWNNVTNILRTITDDPEQVRWAVLGYCRSVMLGREGKAANVKAGEKAAAIMRAFQYNFYDTKAAGLALACWEVVNG